MRRLLLTVLAFSAAPAPAADAMLSTRLFVEQGRPGSALRLGPPPARLTRGQPVVVVVSVAARPGTVIVNPVPAALRFARTDDEAGLSVDGGRTFGSLGQLTVAGRPAGPADVTHLRWSIAGAPDGRASFSFRAVVR